MGNSRIQVIQNTWRLKSKKKNGPNKNITKIRKKSI